MLTSKDLIKKYTRRFKEVLPLCFEYRKQKQWDEIVSLLKDDLQKFEKLPTSLKQNIDQFVRSTLTFFLAEASYHLKQNITPEGLLALDTQDQKINQIKAKTYYLLYRQTGKVEHIDYASKLALEFFGPEHRYTKLFQLELKEKQKELRFQELQAIPNFEAFKDGLDYMLLPKWKMKNLTAIEKLTTEASTTSRMKYKGNESLLRISDQKIQLVPHQQSSLIQFRPTPSILMRESLKLETPIENQNITDLLIPRPQSCKQKIFRRILKTQPTPVKQHNKKESLNQQQLSRNNLLKRSQIKQHNQQILKTSSRQKIEIIQTVMESKSIQCEFSEQPSPIQEKQQEFEFNFSPRIGQSYYSLNTSMEVSRHKIDTEYLHNRIDGLYKLQQEDALRMIIKNFRSFVQKQKTQKTQKNEELMIKSAAKQHFSNLVIEMGATKNVLIDEKISRIKSVLHVCQVIDQGSLKSWMIFSPMRQVNAVCWRIRNISWVIFKRLKAKKTQIHPEIAKLYKEYPKYPQIIEIWSNSIDGTNAIFVLTLQIEVKSKCYDIRLHIKNIQNIAKDFENIFSSTEMVSQLINVYFQSQGIIYQHKNTTQYILSKQTLLRQDMLKKGCQNISNHLNQLFMQSFLFMRAQNGYKFRRLTFSEQILDNQVELYQQIEQRKFRAKKVFTPFLIGTGFFGIKNSNLRNQKLLKSLSIAIENQSPILRSRMSPRNYWQGLRSQSYKVSFHDEILEESSQTPKSNMSSSPRSKKSNHSPKNQTFSSMSSQVMSKKKINEDYFKNYPKERNQMEKEEIPLNPYQSQQILLVYLSFSNEQWYINCLTFTFDFENLQHFGHFQINSSLLYEREHFQSSLPLKDFCCRIDLDINTIKSHLGFYRNLPYIAKLRYLSTIVFEHQKFINKSNYLFPEYKVTRKIQRKSLLIEVNKDHYYIFTYKPHKQFRIIFRIKQSKFKDKDVYALYAYKIAQPIYITIINEQSLTKLQDLVKKIIQQRSSIGEYQKLQSVLYYYLFKEYKAIGCCQQLGFQSQYKQVFNYELKSQQIKDIYQILLKYLVANESNYIKNILRTYCRVNKFQVVSKLNNSKGMNLMLFTEYQMQQDYTILEINIYPFNKRQSSFKTYLNQNDLINFNILHKPVEEKALYLKNLLCLAYNGNSQQVHLQYDTQFNYVNLLNFNLSADSKQSLFIKQKQAIKLIFQKVKKLSTHFIIISIFQNLLNKQIIIQIYIPQFCKQFRSVMSNHDFKLLRPSKLDSIIPSNILENWKEFTIPQRYNGFIEFMKQQKLNNIDDQFSIKSRMSERSGISSLSISKLKEQYEQVQSVQTNKTQQQFMTQSKKSLKDSSKTYFGKLQHPQRVANDTSIFRERVSTKPQISKFQSYDNNKLVTIISQNRNLLCYFWEQMIDDANIIMTDYNKYILQIDSYRGILRQLGVRHRVFIDDDYLAEIYFEQQQVEYGSMFEKYSFISLKESQTTDIYFKYIKLSQNMDKTINLKFQFRQCIYNYSNLTQISYNQALRILKQSSDYITQQIRNNKRIIDFPKVDLKSVTAKRTNKKSIKLENYINNHSKYKFIYSCRLMMNVMLTILYKNKKFYFYMEDCKKQIDLEIKMSIIRVQENIPHIAMLLKCQEEFIIGQRLLQTYKNLLIIKAYEKLFKIS